MGLPRLLVDNFLNTRIPAYAGHVISALENTTDAALVGAARRSTYDAYNSLTANSEAYITVDCGVPRMADTIIVERGHNQAGKTVKCQVSADNFTLSSEDAFNGITPSSAGAGKIDDALGVRTAEGVWLKGFSARAGRYWRYDVPALGSGLVCTVPGLWIGLSWQPGYVARPLAHRQTTLVVQESQSDQGWIGRGKAVRRRQGVLHFEFATMWDAEAAAQHLDQYAAGRRMWVICDDERSEDAFLAVCPTELVGEVISQRRFYPDLDIPFLEADPLG